MINVIICGGSGTRLWPISTNANPKQYLKIFANQSLLQKTILRNKDYFQKNLLVMNEKHYEKAQKQLHEIDTQADYILESKGRNTAPAIACACFKAKADDILFIAPSDHLMENDIHYQKAILRAIELAKENYLVTFGIKPNHPNTGYGYINFDKEDVLSFKEKPNEQTAKVYLAKGNYFWNSGMFCFKAKIFLEELKKYAPEIYEKTKIAYDNSQKNNSLILKKEDMLNIPANSIDYAVMEKSSLVKMVKFEGYWNDLGSFDSLFSVFEKDKNANSFYGDFLQLDSNNNLIINTTKSKVALIEVKNSIIVASADGLLICKADESQRVKEIKTMLEKLNS